MMHKWRSSLFTFLLVGALGLVFLFARPTHADCPDGMTSYWKLDETTPGTYADFISDNDGTGNLDPTAAAGKVNGAQAFDGSTTGIDVQGDRSFDWYQDESFSIEYWIKRDDTVPPAGNEVAVGRNDVRLTNDLHWFTGVTPGKFATCTLRDSDGASFSVTGDVIVVDGAWHHVVVVRDADADVLRLYVDGALDETTLNAIYVAAFKSIPAKLTMGYLEGPSGFRFNGVLDEIALYDRALPLTEIQQHYNTGTGQVYCPGGKGPFPDELSSYWKLDEVAPGTYVDSFNGNDGTGNLDPTAATGQINGAQAFDGSTTGIEVPPDRAFDWYQDESFSIEYWLNRDEASPPTDNEVAVGRNDGVHWWSGITSDEFASFTLRDTSPVSFTVTGTKDVVDGAWHHVVAVRDADVDELRLYVDGALDSTATATYTAGFDSSTGMLTMGWLETVGGGDFYFNGALDEVALYDRALPLAEIQQHYNDGLAGWGIDYIPVAVFTANPISGVYPLTVNFTDQSTGNISSWSWDFGDAVGTSTDQNPTYIYSNVGTYTVSLIVTGPNGTDTETKNGYIVVSDIAPVANFTADNTSGVAPLTVNFTDASTGNITSWLWDFGDAVGTSTDQNPTYIYSNVGTYTVELTVTGQGGTVTETKTDYITVNYPAPVANFTADNTSGVAPLTVNFTDASTGNITSWLWDFGDGVGTSTEQNPSYTYDVEGSYTVGLTVTGPGGSDTEAKTAYITVEKKKSGGGGGGCFIATAAK